MTIEQNSVNYLRNLIQKLKMYYYAARKGNEKRVVQCKLYGKFRNQSKRKRQQTDTLFRCINEEILLYNICTWQYFLRQITFSVFIEIYIPEKFP